MEYVNIAKNTINYIRYSDNNFDCFGVKVNDLKVPSPDEIKTARRKAGLTQQKAADMVHINIRNWQKWEAGENSPPLAAWELFLLKTGQRKLDDS